MSAQLVTAVLAFLDADAAFGPEHPRTQTAKATLRDATAAAVHEDNTVDFERTPLVVIDGGLSAAS